MTSTDSTITKSKSYKIGDMNGKYAILFKLILWLIPFVITIGTPWATWVTYQTIVNSYFREAGARFTPADDLESTQALRKEFHDEIALIHKTIAHLPPQEWKERIKQLDVQMRTVENNQTRIITNQEGIRSRLDQLLHPTMSAATD